MVAFFILIVLMTIEKKDLQSFGAKVIGKKIPDPSNTKEYNQFYLKKKHETGKTRKSKC